MKNEILIYNLPDGESNVEVYLNEDDIWMTQLSLADMFQTSKANITMHIQNIYKEGELQEDRTSKWDLLLRDEGARAMLMPWLCLDELKGSPNKRASLWRPGM